MAGQPNDVFNAIAHPARREILDMLMDQDATVKHISSHFAMSRPAISQHLAILRDAGLVTIDRQGRENYYHLEPHQLQEIERWVRQYDRFWERKLDSLGGFLKGKHGEGTSQDETSDT